jgi:hypothetical protein
MAELTIAASGVRALMDVAVSRGASRTELTRRSLIDPAELEDPDNRVAFSKYVALMRAGQEMCNDPALALHFGEEIDPSEMSFTHQIGARSMAEGMAIMNRYARLTVEVGDEDTDRFAVVRSGGQLWMVDNRRNANAFPELTESGFARIATTMRRMLGQRPSSRRCISLFRRLRIEKSMTAFSASRWYSTATGMRFCSMTPR